MQAPKFTADDDLYLIDVTPDETPDETPTAETLVVETEETAHGQTE